MPQVVKIDEGEDSNHKGDSIHKRLAMRELTGCRARLVPAVIKELGMYAFVMLSSDT